LLSWQFDPGTGYAFSSCSTGTVTIAHEDSPENDDGARLDAPENLRAERQVTAADG
jgi:hypothetical protein